VSDGAVLVVGYGNTLRGDDAVGSRVAELLVTDRRLRGARIETRHQLTPELAADIAVSRLVVLVDARHHGGTPGDVRVEPVDGAGHASPVRSHAVDPGTVVELAERAFGRAPPVCLVSVTGERFDLGAGLSPAVEAALPRVVETVVAIVADHRPGDENVPSLTAASRCRRPKL
jgi:hydrogenase maturation protease